MQGVDALVRRYVDACLDFGTAAEAGNPRRQNAAHDKIRRLFHQLRELGEQAFERLEGVAREHESPYVRLWSATHLLPSRPGEAEGVLEALAASPSGEAAFSAGMVLREWRKGALRFD